MNKLQKVWNDLDKAYEHMENAIEKFDMSEISYMKQLVEEMMENK